MNKKSSLRTYLFDTRIKLYEDRQAIVDKMLASEDPDDADVTELLLIDTQLNIIKDILTICNNRNRY